MPQGKALILALELIRNFYEYSTKKKNPFPLLKEKSNISKDLLL